MDPDTYKKDGCSAWLSKVWIAVTGNPPPFEGCCDKHDHSYAHGGPAYLRSAADRRLLKCVRKNGYPILAVLMWLAVRFGGWPFWPFGYRWGFERAYGAGYRPRKHRLGEVK